MAASLDLPAAGGFDFLEQMRKVPTLAGIPALGLAGPGDEKSSHGKHRVEFEDCQMKFDRDAMLQSLAWLSAKTGEHGIELAIARERK